jgi:hypothetical protein
MTSMETLKSEKARPVLHDPHPLAGAVFGKMTLSAAKTVAVGTVDAAKKGVEVNSRRFCSQ